MWIKCQDGSLALIVGAVSHDIDEAVKESKRLSCELCGKSSPSGVTHHECAAREQFEADQIPSRELQTA